MAFAQRTPKRIGVADSHSNPQSLNRYAYVLNNPVRYTDTSGRMHDPDADYGGGGYYDYYNLSSHPAYRQNWFQERSRWTYISGETSLYWVKPGVQAYTNYLSSETARSQAATAAPTMTSAVAPPASLLLAAGRAFWPEVTIAARGPYPEMYWNAAPPKTYAGREIVVGFDANQVDWGNVALDAASLATVGTAGLAGDAVAALRAEQAGAALSGVQAGQAGVKLLAGSRSTKDELQLGLALAVAYPDPIWQGVVGAASLAIDLAPGFVLRQEVVWQ